MRYSLVIPVFNEEAVLPVLLRRLDALMDRLGIPHAYRDGPERPHDWHGGWVPEAVGLLLEDVPSD